MVAWPKSERAKSLHTTYRKEPTLPGTYCFFCWGGVDLRSALPSMLARFIRAAASSSRALSHTPLPRGLGATTSLLQRLALHRQPAAALSTQSARSYSRADDVVPRVPSFMELPTEIGPLACNVIRDNYGARKKKKILGRGNSSGHGRKCGRGQKGDKARSGGKKGFLKREGSGTPFWQMIPKRGFYKPQRSFKFINLGTLQDHIRSGRLVQPKDRPITIKDLVAAKVIKFTQSYDGVKLLGRTNDAFGRKTPFDVKISIEVQEASARAIEAIEKAGGEISTVYYSRLSMRALLKPEAILKKGQLLPRPSLPPPKLMRRYLDEEKRGYLVGMKPGDVLRPHEQPPHVVAHYDEKGRRR